MDPPLGIEAGMFVRLSLVALFTFGGLSCSDRVDPRKGSRAGDAEARDAGTRFDAARGSQDGGPSPAIAGAIVDLCDPVSQVGCTSPESKCVIEGGTGTKCVAHSTNDGTGGVSCEGRDCRPGLACALPTETSTQATCVQICDLTTGAGCETLNVDQECRTRLEGTNWGACAALEPECDPITQAPCTLSQACQPFLRRSGAWAFRCRRSGSGQEDDACDSTTQVVCARTLACVATPDDRAFCRKICDPTRGNEHCTGTRQCIQRVAEPPFMFCAP